MTVQQLAYRGTQVFVVDTEAERAPLAQQGHIVYSKAEIQIREMCPEITRLSDFLFEIKKRCPQMRVLSARRIANGHLQERAAGGSPRSGEDDQTAQAAGAVPVRPDAGRTEA